MKTMKNSKGKSFKTIPGNRAGDGGGDAETASVAKRSTRGMRSGPGSKGTTVEPYRVRNGAGQSFKTVGSKNNNSDAGAAVDEWCQGKRANYK